MSTIKHPVGPQPEKVYWRRRLLVLLGALAVIIIIVLIVVRPGSGDNSADLAATNTPAPEVATTTQAEPTTPATPGDVATDGGGDANAAACDAANLVVTPLTDAVNYAADVQPNLSFSITNNGSADCKIDVGTAAQIYTVKSGDEVYWLSTDCQTGAANTETVISAGKTLTSTPFAWDRTRSATDTCSATDRPAVPAGGASYHLTVSVGGFDSADSQQFILN